MSEMVERAAEAAWNEASKDKWAFWFSGLSWADIGEGGMVNMREAFIACTRAAIEAMRPDASTMGLMHKLSKKTGLEPSEIDISVCFYLDAALKD